MSDSDSDDDDLPIIDIETIQTLVLPEQVLNDETFKQITGRLSSVVRACKSQNQSKSSPSSQETERRAETASKAPTSTTECNSGIGEEIQGVTETVQNLNDGFIPLSLDGNSEVVKVPFTDANSSDNNRMSSTSLRNYIYTDGIDIDRNQEDSTSESIHHNDRNKTSRGSLYATQGLNTQSQQTPQIVTTNDPAAEELQADNTEVKTDSTQLESYEIELFNKYLRLIECAEQHEMKQRKTLIVVDDNNYKQDEVSDPRYLRAERRRRRELDKEEKEMFEKYNEKICASERGEPVQQREPDQPKKEGSRKANKKRRRQEANERLQKEEKEMFEKYSRMICHSAVREKAERDETDQVTNDDFTWEEYAKDEDMLFTRYEEVIVSAEKCIRKEQILIDRMKEALQFRKDRRTRIFDHTDTKLVDDCDYTKGYQ